MREKKTLDEIVASNVRMLREARGLSTSKVAELMGVSRYLVYDMERPRGGREQREFSWTELVTLCGVLNTTLYELVLPPPDVEVWGDVVRYITDDEIVLSTRWTTEESSVAEVELHGGRQGLSWRVFGVGEKLTPSVVLKLTENARSESARRLAQLEERIDVLLRLQQLSEQEPQEEEE